MRFKEKRQKKKKKGPRRQKAKKVVSKKTCQTKNPEQERQKLKKVFSDLSKQRRTLKVVNLRQRTHESRSGGRAHWKKELKPQKFRGEQKKLTKRLVKSSYASSENLLTC